MICFPFFPPRLLRTWDDDKWEMTTQLLPQLHTANSSWIIKRSLSCSGVSISFGKMLFSVPLSFNDDQSKHKFWDLSFSEQCFWRFEFPAMLRSVNWPAVTHVSNNRTAFIFIVNYLFIFVYLILRTKRTKIFEESVSIFTSRHSVTS